MASAPFSASRHTTDAKKEVSNRSRTAVLTAAWSSTIKTVGKWAPSVSRSAACGGAEGRKEGAAMDSPSIGLGEYESQMMTIGRIHYVLVIFHRW
jgi:hypothetical protein